MPTNWTKKVSQEEALLLENVSAAIKWSSDFYQVLLVAGSYEVTGYYELRLSITRCQRLPKE